MTVENVQSWLTAHPHVFLPLVLILGYLLYVPSGLPGCYPWA
jgi:hypothetical protein